MKKEPLFDLIQSLTMSEKRFFKIFSQRHIIGEVNQYLLMFDFIDKTPEVNNEILLKQSFVKNLSAEKNYLYRLILKSLNAYYYDFSYKMKVQNYITSSEILAYKGLEDQALKLLIKAEKLAEKTELFSHMLTIKQSQFEILSKQNKYDNALEKLDRVKDVSNKHLNLIDAQKNTTKGYQTRQNRGGVRKEQEVDTIEKLLSSPSHNNIDSVKNELYHKSLFIIYLHDQKDYLEEIKVIKSIITLYEQNDFLIEYSVKGYISSLYNLANTYRNLKRHKEALKTLDKIDSLQTNKLIITSKFLSAYAFYLSNNLRLLIYILDKDFKQAYESYKSIKHQYISQKDHIDTQVVYEHLILVIRVLVEFKDFKQALKLSNIIINDASFKKRADIVSYIRLLNLIIHFELKNEFSLEYFSTSTKNYLKRKNRLYKTENEVIHFLIAYEKGNLIVLNKINTKLKKLKNDPFEKSMFTLFDFQNWVEKKITAIK